MEIQKNKKHVKWDQEKLKQSQKYRGTFEKIIEPKTPYRKNESSDQEELMVQQPKSEQQIGLEKSLKTAKTNSHLNSHKKANISFINAKLKQELEKFKQNGGNIDMEDEDQEQKIKKREQFKKKRDQHYNQFKMIQKMKKSEQWEDEDDD